MHKADQAVDDLFALPGQIRIAAICLGLLCGGHLLLRAFEVWKLPSDKKPDPPTP